MGQNSTIEWTNHTFNPWWGCVKVSEGCAHCYAEIWANRYGFKLWGLRRPRRTFGNEHWREPLRWNKVAAEKKQHARVFCASMADVFESVSSVEGERQKLWALIEQTTMLDWLLLTKRPENMRLLAPWKKLWPPNVWAMTSVESQKWAEKRIPFLLDVPAQVHGLSVEPLLEPVSLEPWIERLDWVIVGGESGEKARPMHPSWVRKIRDLCAEYDVAFFFKQWGQWKPKSRRYDENTSISAIMEKVGKKKAGRKLDGKTWSQFPT